MADKSRRIAVMLDLKWPYKRHADTFAGTQQYAEKQGWHSIIDEFAHDTLPTQRNEPVPYDGIIARANTQLAQRAYRIGLPVVNVWMSSPARHALPGVFPDCTAVGHLCAEHLLARGVLCQVECRLRGAWRRPVLHYVASS
jgi:LacI family transcriptional regulator